ncbi:uncharacterized protein LAJ45_09342 [Morchella importuna]|uniref:uncharacterized protein n=1 Tax=Morchella importuna TaxID=1174673 RepID=UPI001E8D386B|nr:uncharacterized protein LAJ45_09342 [Morchella importuna]KAH8146659.1 hypothetical protein LAJ45_09342 [Morchella importuna]
MQTSTYNLKSHTSHSYSSNNPILHVAPPSTVSKTHIHTPNTHNLVSWSAGKLIRHAYMPPSPLSHTLHTPIKERNKI